MERKLFKTLVFKESGMRLDYYILKEIQTLEEEQAEVFGVQITQSPLNAFSNCSYISHAERDITSEYEKIIELAKLLAESETDPVLLKDMVEEFI